MNQLERFKEIMAVYQKHGWRVQKVLMKQQTRAGINGPEGEVLFEKTPVQEAMVDAIWFARPSQGGREAWELRLVSDTPYALFETFEPDEEEEDRQQVRREMEVRLCNYAMEKRPAEAGRRES